MKHDTKKKSGKTQKIKRNQHKRNSNAKKNKVKTGKNRNSIDIEKDVLIARKGGNLFNFNFSSLQGNESGDSVIFKNQPIKSAEDFGNEITTADGSSDGCLFFNNDIFTGTKSIEETISLHNPNLISNILLDSKQSKYLKDLFDQYDITKTGMLVKGVDFVDDNEVFMLLYQGLKSPPINLLLNDDDKYEESELTDFKNSIFSEELPLNSSQPPVTVIRYSDFYRNVASKVGNIRSLFNESGDFFDCVRTIVEHCLFVNDDYETYKEYKQIIKNLKTSLFEKSGDINLPIFKDDMINVEYKVNNEQPQQFIAVIKEIKYDFATNTEVYDIQHTTEYGSPVNTVETPIFSLPNGMNVTTRSAINIPKEYRDGTNFSLTMTKSKTNIYYYNFQKAIYEISFENLCIFLRDNISSFTMTRILKNKSMDYVISHLKPVWYYKIILTDLDDDNSNLDYLSEKVVKYLSKAQRKHIYRVMSSSGQIKNGDEMRKFLFDGQSLDQINTFSDDYFMMIQDSRQLRLLNHSMSYESEIEKSDEGKTIIQQLADLHIEPFPTNIWDMKLCFKPEPFTEYIESLAEARSSLKDKYGRVNPKTDNLLDTAFIHKVFANLYGEAFERTSFSYYFLRNKKTINNNTGNVKKEPDLFFRYSNLVGFSDKETEKKQGYLNNFTLVRDKLKYHIFGDLWTEKVSRCQKLLYMRFMYAYISGQKYVYDGSPQDIMKNLGILDNLDPESESESGSERENIPPPRLHHSNLNHPSGPPIIGGRRSAQEGGNIKKSLSWSKNLEDPVNFDKTLPPNKMDVKKTGGQDTSLQPSIPLVPAIPIDSSDDDKDSIEMADIRSESSETVDDDEDDKDSDPSNYVNNDMNHLFDEIIDFIKKYPELESKYQTLDDTEKGAFHDAVVTDMSVKITEELKLYDISFDYQSDRDFSFLSEQGGGQQPPAPYYNPDHKKMLAYLLTLHTANTKVFAFSNSSMFSIGNSRLRETGSGFNGGVYDLVRRSDKGYLNEKVMETNATMGLFYKFLCRSDYELPTNPNKKINYFRSYPDDTTTVLDRIVKQDYVTFEKELPLIEVEDMVTVDIEVKIIYENLIRLKKDLEFIETQLNIDIDTTTAQLNELENREKELYDNIESTLKQLENGAERKVKRTEERQQFQVELDKIQQLDVTSSSVISEGEVEQEGEEKLEQNQQQNNQEVIDKLTQRIQELTNIITENDNLQEERKNLLAIYNQQKIDIGNNKQELQQLQQTEQEQAEQSKVVFQNKMNDVKSDIRMLIEQLNVQGYSVNLDENDKLYHSKTVFESTKAEEIEKYCEDHVMGYVGMGAMTEIGDGSTITNYYDLEPEKRTPKYFFYRSRSELNQINSDGVSDDNGNVRYTMGQGEAKVDRFNNGVLYKARYSLHPDESKSGFNITYLIDNINEKMKSGDLESTDMPGNVDISPTIGGQVSSPPSPLVSVSTPLSGERIPTGQATGAMGAVGTTGATLQSLGQTLDPQVEAAAQEADEETKKGLFISADQSDRIKPKSARNKKINDDSPSPFIIDFSDEKWDEVYDFLNEKTNGLLSSATMKDYKDEIITELKIGNIKIMLANQEDGCIYAFTQCHMQLGRGGSLNQTVHLPLCSFIQITSMKNIHESEDPEIEKYIVILWFNPSDEQKYQIKMGNQRMYFGFLKKMWEDLDKDVKHPTALSMKNKDIKVVSKPVDDKQINAKNIKSLNELDRSAGEDIDHIPDVIDGLDKDESDKNALRDDFPVPDTISVKIVTTVPGYQDIDFRPYMIDKTLNDTSERRANIKERNGVLRLNPLIPLSEKAINNVQEQARRVQFVDPYLFGTLINRAATESMFGVKKITFEEAVKKNIVEQNIRLTLNTIFKPGSQLYLAGKTFTIYDSHFTETEWKLEPKDRIEGDFSMRKVLDANILASQQRKGIKEIQEIPTALQVGPDNTDFRPPQYNNLDSDKENNSDKGIKLPQPTKPVALVGGVPIKVPDSDKNLNPFNYLSNGKNGKRNENASLNNNQNNQNNQNITDITNISNPSSRPVSVSTSFSNVSVPVPLANYEQPNASNRSNALLQMKKFFVKGEEIEYYDNNNGTQIRSTSNDTKLTRTQQEDINVTNAGRYFGLINMLNEVSKEQSNIYSEFFKLGTNKITGDGKKFTIKNYTEEQVRRMQMIEVPKDGNCFFQCIAHAINIHNSYVLLEDNKGGKIGIQNPPSVKGNDTGLIEYQEEDVKTGNMVKRTGTEFTQEFIRWTLINYYRKHQNELVRNIANANIMIDGYEKTMEWFSNEFGSFINDDEILRETLNNAKLEQENSSDMSPPPLNTQYNNVTSDINMNENGGEDYMVIQSQLDIIRQDALMNSSFVIFDSKESDESQKEKRPFRTPKTISEAEEMFMSSNTFANHDTIPIVEKIFAMKTIPIQKTEIVEIVDGNNSQLKKKTTRFQVSGMITLDSAEEKRKAVKTNKIIFLSYEDSIHYNLILFNNATTRQQSKQNLKKPSTTIMTLGGGTRKKRPLNKIFKHSYFPKQEEVGKNKTRKIDRVGGAETTLLNRKKSIFFKNNLNDITYGSEVLFDLEKDTEDEENEIRKIPRIDDINSSIPMYIVFLLYADRFSMIRDRNNQEERNNIMETFILFYIEFQIIEKFIASFNDEALETFIHLFNRVFGSVFRPGSIPRLNRVDVINISDTSSDFADFSVDSLDRDNNVMFQQQLTPDNRMSITNINTPYTNSSMNQQLIQQTPFTVDNAPPIMGFQGQNIPSGFPITPPGSQIARRGGQRTMTYTKPYTPYGGLNREVVNILNNNKSNLSFHVTVHLILAEGDKINFGDKFALACESSAQEIRRNWAKITGQDYYPTPRSLTNVPSSQISSMTLQSGTIESPSSETEQQASTTTSSNSNSIETPTIVSSNQSNESPIPSPNPPLPIVKNTDPVIAEPIDIDKK